MDSLSGQPSGELPGLSVPLAPVAGGLLEPELLADELLLSALEEGGDEPATPLPPKLEADADCDEAVSVAGVDEDDGELVLALGGV
jgi:hypothetical protein